MSAAHADLLSTGLAHHRAGRLAHAARCYRDLLAASPDHADALHLTGLAAHAAGDHAQAVAQLQRAVRLRPDAAHFRTNLGAAQSAAGDHAAAAATFRAAVDREPADARTWHDLGRALLLDGRAGEAEPALRAALARAETAAAQADLGACLHRLGRLAEAADALRAALILAPDLEPALACLGLVLAALGRTAEAEAALRAALARRPDRVANLTNLGNFLGAIDRPDEAATLLRDVVRLRPDDADARHNLAVVLAGGDPELAAAECRRALALRPDHADAQYLQATLLLRAGRMPQGWAGLEWCWRRAGFSPPRQLREPAWDGLPLDGRTLLLHAEQGLGDAIQMLRFVPAIAATGRVRLELPEALQRLAATLPGAARALPAAGPFDAHCPLPSLPFVLGVVAEAIPPAPYLRALPADVGRWSRRVAALPGLRVGLCWAGNPGYGADRRRSIPAALLAALATPGISFVSLQPGAAAPDLAMHDWTAGLFDLAETAALIECLDLVVSVDTAVAHLAGALGRPVWLLNRFDSCWRWLRGRADSPWYPSLRVITQDRPGDWAGVLTTVRADMQALRQSRVARKLRI